MTNTDIIDIYQQNIALQEQLMFERKLNDCLNEENNKLYIQNKLLTEMYICLKELRKEPNNYLRNTNRPGGQDQYAGMPPALRLIDPLLEKYENIQ